MHVRGRFDSKTGHTPEFGTQCTKTAFGLSITVLDSQKQMSWWKHGLVPYASRSLEQQQNVIKHRADTMDVRIIDRSKVMDGLPIQHIGKTFGFDFRLRVTKFMTR